MLSTETGYVWIERHGMKKQHLAGFEELCDVPVLAIFCNGWNGATDLPLTLAYPRLGYAKDDCRRWRVELARQCVPHLRSARATKLAVGKLRTHSEIARLSPSTERRRKSTVRSSISDFSI